MKREFVVGLVFFVLVALLLAATLWIKDPNLLDRGEGHSLTTRFRDVAGLKVGDEVWLYGTEAGRVTGIQPDGQGNVLVDLSLTRDPELRGDAEVAIRTRSALGGSVVSIHPGTPEGGEAAAGVLDGKATQGMFEEINRAVADIRGPLKESIENIRKVSGDLAERSESIVENVDEFVINARELTDDLKSGKGTLGKLFQDDKLYTDLEAAIASIKQVADDASGGGGALDVLLHDTQLAADLKETVNNAKSVTAKLDRGDGALGKLLNDPRLYDDLAATAADLKEVAAAARSGQGALGKLLYDQELAGRIDRISKDMAQVTGKLRKGEGTLGKLIQDEELYAELRGTLKTLQAGAGDARENAPILTFAGFLFGGF